MLLFFLSLYDSWNKDIRTCWAFILKIHGIPVDPGCLVAKFISDLIVCRYKWSLQIVWILRKWMKMTQFIIILDFRWFHDILYSFHVFSYVFISWYHDIISLKRRLRCPSVSPILVSWMVFIRYSRVHFQRSITEQ